MFVSQLEFYNVYLKIFCPIYKIFGVQYLSMALTQEKSFGLLIAYCMYVCTSIDRTLIFNMRALVRVYYNLLDFTPLYIAHSSTVHCTFIPCTNLRKRLSLHLCTLDSSQHCTLQLCTESVQCTQVLLYYINRGRHYVSLLFTKKNQTS